MLAGGGRGLPPGKTKGGESFPNPAGEDLDLAVVGVHDPLGYGQAQPRTLAAAPARGVRAEEAVEHVRGVGRRDAHALVGHGESHAPGAVVGQSAQAHARAGRGVARGVLHHDAHGLLHHGAVGHELRGPLVALRLVDVIGVDHLRLASHLGHELGHVERLAHEALTAGVPTGQEQQLLHELLHVAGFGLERAYGLLQHGRV